MVCSGSFKRITDVRLPLRAVVADGLTNGRLVPIADITLFRAAETTMSCDEQ
jgi:hypothetical protein